VGHSQVLRKKGISVFVKSISGMIGTSCAVGIVERCGKATTSGEVFGNRKAAKRKAAREEFLFVLLYEEQQACQSMREPYARFP